MIIYIITHKKYNEPIIEGYRTLQVGTDLNKDLYDGYIKDNTGENISYKNKLYCELTGLYWMWKNSKEDVIGLCHYRRYMTLSKMIKYKYKYSDIINKTQIERMLVNYDIILPKKLYVLESISKHYVKYHQKEDLDILREVVSVKSPQYIKSFDKVMNGNYMYCYNMFIGKKHLIDKYCEWLFMILDEVERRTDISKYNDYQKRIYGFMSERLLNVWVNYNNLNVKEVKIFNTEEKYKTKVLSLICRIIYRIKYKIKSYGGKW